MDWPWISVKKHAAIVHALKEANAALSQALVDKTAEAVRYYELAQSETKALNATRGEVLNLRSQLQIAEGALVAERHSKGKPG